jgi:hypothetical protein
MLKASFLRWMAVAALVATCLMPAAASAQGNRDGERLRRELEKTDEVMSRARDIVRDAMSARGRQMLEAAQDVQRNAWQAFHGRRERLAFDLTMRARDEALRAIRFSESEFRAVERIRNLLDSTSDLVGEASAVVPQSGDQEAIRLFDAGRLQLTRAHEAFRDRRFRQALTLTLTSRDLLLRALRLAEDSPAASPDRLREVIERTEALAREADAAGAADDRRARELLEQGNRQLDQAREAARDGRPRLAFQRAMAARERFLDVLRLSERSLGKAEVAAEVEATGRLLADEGPRIRSSGVRAAVDLLDAALARQATAEDHLARERLRPALAETKISESLVRKALDMIAP